MKTAIIIFGLALTFLLSGLVGQTPTPTTTPTERQYRQNDLAFCAEIQGCWLFLRGHSSKEKWDPCFVDITSDFRPVVQKDGAKWRIIFETQDVTTEFVP